MIELNKKQEINLTNILNKALEIAVIENGNQLQANFLIQLYQVETAISKNASNKNRKQLETIIGEDPIFTFFYHKLSTDIEKQRPYNAEHKKINLNDIEEFKDLEQVTKKLINDVKSLPWHYSSLLFLNDDIAKHFNDVNITSMTGEKISLVKIDDNFNKTIPKITKRATGLASLFAGNDILQNNKEWEKDKYCIQIFNHGYFFKYGKSNTSELLSNNIKSFFGLGLALNMFEIARDKFKHSGHNVLGFPDYRNDVQQHIKKNEKWEIVQNKQIDQSITDTVKLIKLNPLLIKNPDLKSRNKFTTIMLGKIFTPLNNPDPASELILASQWFFDSFSGTDKRFSFIQLITVLEVLLGNKNESEKIGLGTLLKNRCAYLISDTQDMRDKVLNDFVKIYEIRSNILHNGKNQLSKDDNYYFLRLQWICQQIIQKEVKMLQNQLRKNNHK